MTDHLHSYLKSHQIRSTQNVVDTYSYDCPESGSCHARWRALGERRMGRKVALSVIGAFLVDFVHHPATLTNHRYDSVDSPCHFDYLNGNSNSYSHELNNYPYIIYRNPNSYIDLKHTHHHFNLLVDIRKLDSDLYNLYTDTDTDTYEYFNDSLSNFDH